MITAHLFGEFVIVIDQTRHEKFRTSKVQALLAYLLQNRETRTQRDVLYDLLWPGLPQKSAQVNLRQTLYQARKVLAGAIEKPIVSASGSLQLNPELVISADTAQFNDLLKTVKTHDHIDLRSCADCRAWLEQAVDLYKETFLNNVYLPDSNVFEAWVVGQRTRYERQFFDALATLTTIYLYNNRYADADALARRQLARDALREVAYQQLMEAQAQNGQREAALATYDRCRSILHNELGMSPTQRTTQLAERIAGGEVDLAPVFAPDARGYELLDKLGSGAFGVVHRAYQPLIGREVAVKIIKPEFANRPNFIRRFEVEAQTIAKLEHPYIVPLYDYWRDPNGAFLVMRYLRGGSLATAVQTQTVWQSADVLKLVEQIGSALATAHEHDIVHRDLKPANILLDEAGNAYLSDFGIARQIMAEGESTPDVAMLTSSPYYTSPEQLRGDPITPRSDIYTFGLLIFELLSGRKPFTAASLGNVLQQHLSGALPSLHAIRPDLSPELDTLLFKATAKDPADRIADVQTLTTQLQTLLADSSVATMQPLVAQVEGNPYKGLRAFQEGDAELFFGRKTLIDQLLTHLETSRFLAVVGPSGSGKSSVVKAGLLPKLRVGAIDGSEDWFITEMVPSTHPLEELEAALLRVAVDPPTSLIEPLEKDERGLIRILKRILPTQDGQLLLVIDQFEELFTLTDSQRRQQFLDNLLAALNVERSQLRVVITLRADFYDKPLQISDLAERIQAHNVVITPLSAVELEQAIVQPAYLAGVRFENGLVTRIVDDVRDQPSILPLLQFALTELFERRENNIIPLSAYEEIGGVTGVLGKQAEAIFWEFSAENQALTRQLFLRLITLGEGVEDTRRRVLQSELAQLTVNSEQLTASDQSKIQNPNSKIQTAFGAARLLSFDRDPATREPTVEVAHEALLREWSRLRGWLEESREDVRMQRLVGRGSAEWQAANNDPAYLLRGSRLEQFASWAEGTSVALTTDERVFLDASRIAQAQRIAEEEARHQRELEQARQHAEEQTIAAGRLRQRAVWLAGAMVIATVLAVTAFIFGNRATQNANLAATQEMNAVANANLAATSETEAQNNADLAATREADAIAAQRIAEEQTALTRSRELALASINQLDSDAELSVLLALEALETYYTIEAEEALHRAVQRSRVLLRLETGGVYPMAEISYSPDGSQIAGFTWRETEAGFKSVAYVWDADSGAEVFSVDEGLGMLPSRLDYSPEGSEIVFAFEDIESGGLVKILDSQTGQVKHSLDILPARLQSDNETGELWVKPAVVSVQYSPDGKQLATSQFDMEKMYATVWDLETGEALFELTGFGWTTLENAGWQDGPNYSADGRYLSGGGEINRGYVWDALTGDIVISVTHEGESGWNGAIIETVIVNNETQLITSGMGGLLRLWDIENGQLLQEFDTNSIGVFLEASDDGSKLAYPTDGGNYRLVSADLENVLVEVSTGDTGGGGEATFHPNGQRMAVKGENGGVVVWDISAEKEVMTLQPSNPAGGGSVVYDPTGKIIATGGFDGVINIWDVESGEPVQRIATESMGIGSLAISLDGQYLVAGEFDGQLKQWDLITGEMIRALEGHDAFINQVAFSPDGLLFATTGDDEIVRIWRGETGDLLHTLPQHTLPFGVGFSPDSQRIAVTYISGDISRNHIRVFDVASGEEIQQMESAERQSQYVHFTTDGQYLVAGSQQAGKIFVWDSYTGEEINSFETGRSIRSTSLLSDDRRIVIGTLDGTVEVWELARGERLSTLMQVDNERQIVTVSPDEQHVAAVSYQDGLVRILTLDLNELTAIGNSRLTRGFTPTECVEYRIIDCSAEP